MSYSFFFDFQGNLNVKLDETNSRKEMYKEHKLNIEEVKNSFKNILSWKLVINDIIYRLNMIYKL